MDKKRFALLLLLFLIPSVLALETNLKEEYQPGETLIMEISGNFIDNIQPEDVLFYSGRAYIGMLYDVGKVQDKFFIYAQLPDNERNYTLVIKDAHYYDMGKEIKEDLRYNFTVKGDLVEFSVSPGFVITNKDFEIKAGSRFKDLEIEADFLNSTQNISVLSGRTKTIVFPVEDIEGFTITDIIISSEVISYEIPVVIFKSEEEKEQEEIEKSKILRFSRSENEFLILKDSAFNFKISLTNTGDEDLENIEFNYSELEDILTIRPSKIAELESGERIELNLTLLSPEKGTQEGLLRAVSGNYTASTFISIETFENESSFQEAAEKTSTEGETCEELGGVFCEGEEYCDGNYKLTLDYVDNLCCVGTCKKEQESKSKTIALIVVIVILAGIIFYAYRKLKFRKKTSREILKEKEEAYEKRFKPTETRGGLSRE